jgi:hypothetical protein
MEWELWWNGECIDVTYTREYAETLRYEYQMAFFWGLILTQTTLIERWLS